MAKQTRYQSFNFVDPRATAQPTQPNLIKDIVPTIRNLKSAKWKFVGIGTVVALLLVIVMLSVSHKSASLFPADATRGLQFSLYYPSKLPRGYYVDRASFQQQGKVMIFYIRTPENKAIGVSEEAVPLGTTLPQAGKTPIAIPGEKDFTWTFGRTHIALEGANYVSETITNDDTWIILNATGLTPDQATALTQSFATAQ